MTRAPKNLSTRPAQLVDRTDVLSELLDTLRLATLVHDRRELAAPWRIELPDDDAALLIAVLRGGAQLEGDGAGRPRLLAAGDLVLLPHGGAHRLRHDDASTLLTCAFRFRAAHRTHSIQRLGRCIHMRADDPRAAAWLRPTAQLLASESASQHPGAAVVMNRLADVLLVQMIRAFIAGTECKSHGLRALMDPQIGKALALVHDRPAEPWTVERLASRVALSRSGFAARFRALVGEPPLEYVARWRMTKAAQLLRESDVAMSEIAARSGYQSEAAFHKAFKRLEGVTPGAYRRAARS